ncbi:DUF4430 domain-containing protein [Anaerovoracaceae bacterium 42-11]
MGKVKNGNSVKKILTLVLAFMMVFTMLPSMTWADTAADGENAAPAAQNAEQVNITLYGHNAFFSSMKLYKWDGKEKQGEDLLNGADRTNDKYSISVEEGAYLVEGYKNNGETPECLGSIVFDVTKDGTHDFELYAVTGIKASNSGWVLDEDYTMKVKILEQDNTEKNFELGEVNAYGETVKSCIAFKGNTVTAVFSPDEEKHPDFMETSASATLTSNRSGLSASCQQVVTLTITAPENSEISAGTLSSYYVYNFASPISTGTTGENKVEAVFKIAKNKDYFYRVKNPKGVTYWNYGKWSESASVDVTAEDLYISSSEFGKDTVFHNYEKNVYDRADIYLNINQAGYMNMDVDDTYELNCFRNWFAIENTSNAKVALPDMHYEVIDTDGKSSDVVAITPDDKNSNAAVLRANKPGTAIVMVTYDAMTHMQGMSKAAAGGESTKQFSAIWPECTGVFVVSVDKDGTGIKTNMQLDRFGEPSTFDAEHDILFYTGDEGASYSFKPEDGCKVSVARSTVNSKMSFSGFTEEGIETDENGKVTVTGLKTGRHIIKVEKVGMATYQVVTARGVSYKMLDKDGNELPANTKVRAGDKIKIQFSGLVNPQEKLSGVYNFNARLYYQGEDDTFFQSNPGGAFGVYDFSGNPDRQIIEITIPKYWSGESYTLNGSIKMGGFAGIPTHRAVSYKKGAQPGFNAPAASSILGQLPEICIPLEETEFISAKLNFKDQNGNPVDRAGLSISLKDTDNNKIIVSEDGSFKCLESEYSYTINAKGYEYKTGTVSVTSENNTFDIELKTTSENAWDGVAKREPEKDTEGVYLISSGAEMAWFAENAKKINGIRGKLIADIDLGKYPWTAGDFNYGKSEFDGSGYRIYNFQSGNGLFGMVGGSSTIKNLTLEGKIVSKSGTVGTVAKYLQSGTIEKCINKVDITATGTNNSCFGGIAGYTYNGSLIKNCVNEGAVSAEGSQAGGILGYTVGENAKIEDCINKGAVTGGSTIGGIIGKETYGIEITNCYNTGNVSGNADVGGIVGETEKTRFTSCYSSGTVTGGKGFAGKAAKSSFTKCYYQEDGSNDDSAEALTAEELKSADLGEGFKNVCDEKSPKLLWEEGEAHQGTVLRTVAPTCTKKGYDVSKCKNCNEEYRMNYAAALGHDFCTHESAEEMANCKDCRYTAPTCTEDGSLVHICKRDGCAAEKAEVLSAKGHTSDSSKEKKHPAYTECVCSTCGVQYTVWNDDRLQFMVLPEKGIADVFMKNEGDYPWNWEAANARFESSNGGVGKSKSKTELSFTLSEEKTLSFEYGVSSEKKYDKTSIRLLKTGGETEIIADGISGAESKNYSKLLTAGKYTLSFEYEKDSSGDQNDDLGYIKNLKISDKPELPQNPEAKPSVTFRLIGCEKAKRDVDLGADKYLPKYETWITTTVYTLEELGEDATVGTVFKKALDKANLSYEGFDSNYISSITSPSGYVLSEMTNGLRSGWMYTVNGNHPNVALNDCKVKDGDVIIWHYVNDYSYEVQDWIKDDDHPALGDASTWNGWLNAPDSTDSDSGSYYPTPDNPDDGDTDIDDPNTPLDPGTEAVKSMVSSMKLTARSARTSKKNVKVTVKADKATDSVITELKEMGYTVKYMYFRSTKKSSGYKSMLTKNAKTYTNTVGKKGQRYYYRAQIRVYDKDGKLIAKTMLKQCEYANRIWKK